MTTQEQKEAIRQACIKANPSIKSVYHKSITNNLRCRNCGELDNYDNFGKCKKGEEREIRLADILWMITKVLPYYNQDLTILTDGTILNNKGEVSYNLLKDTLDEQPPETIEFIYNLIK